MGISRAKGQREVAISGSIFSSLALCKDNRELLNMGVGKVLFKKKNLLEEYSCTKLLSSPLFSLAAVHF